MMTSTSTWIILLLIILPGCGTSTQDVLVDYRERVERVTRAEDIDVDVPPIATWPRPRALTVPLPEFRIGLLDFLSLDPCPALSSLVAERNSGLGRVLAPSQRLLYEHRFLVAAGACADTLAVRNDPEMASRLRQVIDEKEGSLPAVLWNAVFGSRDMARLMALGDGPLPVGAPLSPPGSAVRDALARLRSLRMAIGTTAVDPDPAAFEAPFRQLQASRYGGSLLQSAALLARELGTVAVILERRLVSGRLCPQGVDTRESETLMRIFHEIYGVRVQPYLARVHREGDLFFADWTGLADTLVPTPDFSVYQQAHLGPGGTWPRFEAAIDRHNTAWQGVLDACGSQLGGDG